MIRIYFFLMFAIFVSCKASPSVKDFGLITSDTGYAASIDTSNHVRPTTLIFNSYTLANTSTNHKIKFVCKASIKDKAWAWTHHSFRDSTILLDHSETHVLAPQRKVQLDIEGNNQHHVIKYEIIDAAIIDR